MKKVVKKLGLSKVSVRSLDAVTGGAVKLTNEACSISCGCGSGGTTYSSEFTDGAACTGAQTQCQAG